jgi:hypothetical protein
MYSIQKNCEYVWGNLKAMIEKGEIFKNYQTKTSLLESKISKNILVDCTFINSMQTIPLKLTPTLSGPLLCLSGEQCIRFKYHNNKFTADVRIGY